MHYTTNALQVSPEKAFDSALAALLSYEKPNIKSDNADKVVIIPQLLTAQATILSLEKFRMICLITIQPYSESSCCLHVYADFKTSDGNEAISYRFLANYLERFISLLSQNNSK